MPVPSSVSDLSSTASSNYPTGGEAVGTSLDDYLRAHAAIIRQVSDDYQASDAAINASMAERIPEIGTYAALRAYTGGLSAFLVRGVANIFDGGFGVFRVDSTDTTSADNGGTILVDSSGRRWKRDYSGGVDIKWFGAYGVLDATAKIQDALNSAAPLVLVTSGQFFISSALSAVSNQELRGAGGTITMTNGTFADGISVSGKTNVVLRSLRLIGASGGNSFDRAILINSSSNVTVDDCLIQDIGQEVVTPNEWGHGVEILGTCSSVKIINNRFKNIKGYGQYRGDCVCVRASGDTLISGNTFDTNRRMQVSIIDDAVDVKVTGNHFLNGYLAGIDVEPNSINTTGKIIITGNTFRNFGSKPGATVGVQYYGVDLHANDSNDIVVTGNTFHVVASQTLYCVNAINGVQSINVSDNVMNCGGVSNGIGLSAGNGSKSLVIANNIIRDFDTIGIFGDKNGELQVSGNLLSTAVATVTHGVYLSAAASPSDVRPVISDNIVKIASAAGVAGIFVQAATIPVVTGNSVNVTAGNGIEMYSNVAGMVGGVLADNMVYGNGSSGNGYFVRAAGAGSIAGLVQGNNQSVGFTTPFTTSGPVTFASNVGDAYLGVSVFGNTSTTLTYGASGRTAIFNTALTAARTVTLSTTNAAKGNTFRIVRTATATGAFNLDVGGLKTLTAAGQWCEVTFDGSAWVLTANGSL